MTGDDSIGHGVRSKGAVGTDDKSIPYSRLAIHPLYMFEAEKREGGHS
jgi:hypothetical protein